MIEIDGSYGEGGGAILRTAVGLSVFTQKPIHVYNIRKNRQNPGLKEQHLQGIKAVAELCSGKLKGAELNSTEISFFPEKIFAERVKVRVETAGSVGLVLQALQIASLKAKNPVKVEISGGATYGKWAPPIDFVKDVTYKILEKMGYKIELKVESHGFYPKGGAKVSAIFHPAEKISPLNLVESGKILSVKGISIASRHLESKKVAERQKVSSRGEIFNRLNFSADIKTEYFDTESAGSAISLCLTTQNGAILGAAEIGEQKISAEVVGKNAAQSLIEDFQAGATVDKRTLDQIIPFLALSQTDFAVKFSELTKHSHTNIWACEHFFGKTIKIHDNLLTKSICSN